MSAATASQHSAAGVDFPEVDGLDVEHRFVHARGLRFHVAEAGDGPPLLLLHGWPQHWWMWRNVLPALSRKFRCIAPDLRGMGWTDAPEDGYEKPNLADDMAAVLDELGLDRVRVMGHDWGAVTTILLATNHADRVVKGLALSAPPPWDTTPDPRRLAGGVHMPFLASPFGAQISPQLAQLVLRGSGMSAANAEVYLERLRQPERRHASSAFYRSFILRDLPASLRRRSGKPDVPIHCMGGAGDPVVRWSRDIEKVPGAGHFLPEEMPEPVIDRALEFLA